MRLPTVPWVGYNLLRLVAVIFMAWTLVVQFITLSSDLKEYTRVRDTTSAEEDDGTVVSSITAAISSSPSSTLNPVMIGTVADVATTAQEEREPITMTATTTMPRVTDLKPIGAVRRDCSPRLGGAETLKGSLESRDEPNDDEPNAEDEEESYYGTSAIPDQPGGVFFVLVWRLLLAIALTLLLCVQVGLPEDLRYKYGGYLGPPSTPMTLGMVQLLIAIQTLSVHAATSMLIPSFALIGMGGVNILLGAALQYMARRVPKDPPPPLYFSKMMRLLYWTPLPSFYNQLNPAHPSHPSNNTAPVAQTRREAKCFKPSNDLEKQDLPPSNALEIGLEESDDDDWVKVENQKIKTRTRPSRPVQSHTDVRKGGYPTFSGHGVGVPGRNVPAGQVEAMGDRVAFVSEDARAVKDGARQRPSSTSSVKEPSSRGKDSRGAPSKAQERKSRLAPLAIPGKQPTLPLRRPPGRSNSRDSTLSTVSSATLKPRVSLKQSTGGQALQALTPIGEEPSSAMTNKSDLRRSIQAAASDLGPHFPLPPSRSDSSDSTSSITGTNVGQEPVERKMRARRESSVDSLSGTAAPWAALAKDPLEPTHEPMPTSPLRLLSKTAKGTQKPSSDVTKPELPKTPRTPKSAKPILHAPQPPSAEPSPVTPSESQRRKGTVTAQPSPRRVTMLRPSLAPPVRSPSTASAHTERVSQGVRFDINSPQAVTPSTGTLTESTATPGVLSPRSAFRIPGTNFTIPVPFAAPSTPRPARQVSIDSVESGFSAARPESMASTTSDLSLADDERPELVARTSSGTIDPSGMRRPSDERAGLPRRKDSLAGSEGSNPSGKENTRPRSMAVLGGGYLDGGRETQKERRRFSSIDSS